MIFLFLNSFANFDNWVIVLLSVSPISLEAPWSRSVSPLQLGLHEDRSCAFPLTAAALQSQGLCLSY